MLAEIVIVSQGETPRKRGELRAFSSLILGCKPAFYFPLKEVKASRPIAEVSENRQSTLWHWDSDSLKHTALFSCAGCERTLKWRETI